MPQEKGLGLFSTQFYDAVMCLVVSTGFTSPTSQSISNMILLLQNLINLCFLSLKWNNVHSEIISSKFSVQFVNR